MTSSPFPLYRRQSGKFCWCCDCDACSEAREQGLIAPPRQSGSGSSNFTAVEGERTTSQSPNKASQSPKKNNLPEVTETITPNIPPPTMTSTKRVVRINRNNIPKMPKLDETTEGAGTDSDSDTSYRTRDAEITDETMDSSSNSSPDTTVPESEPVNTEITEETGRRRY